MRSKPLWAAAVFVLAASLYLPALDYPFQFDDHLHLRDGNIEAGHWQALVWPPAPRPLTWLTLLWQRQWFGADPAAFRGLNLALHALNAVLVFLILARLLTPQRATGTRNPGGITMAAAFFGALCFAWHPVQSEAVLLVYQRSTLLASGFAFAGLLIWMRTGERDRSFWQNAAVAACFLLAVASKEFMAVLPAVLWFWDGLARGRWKPPKLLLAMLGAGGAVAVGQVFFGDAVAPIWTSLTYAATQVRVWWLYGLLVVGAIPQNVDHAVAPQTALDGWWWLSVVGLAACAGVVFRLRRVCPRAAFCASAWALFLLPTSSFLPSPDPMFEHRIYASMLGLAGLAALGLRSAMGRRASRRLAALAIAGVLLVLQAGAAHRRSQVWADPITLWRDAAAKSPGKYRPRYNYGVALSESDPEAAERQLSEAVAIDPSQPLAYRALGDLKLRRGDRRAARSFWEQARILDPTDWRTWNALGGLHLADRDYRLASERLGEAARLAPKEPEPRLQLARLNLLFGFVKPAIEQAEAGLEWNPDSTELVLALAEAVSAEANWTRAEELFRRALEIDPRQSQAHYGLARALFNLGRREDALDAAREGRIVASTPTERQVGDALILRFGEEK